MALNTKDGISIRIMTEKDYDSVKPFMREEFFTAEPLSQSTGEPVHLQNEKDNDEYYLSMIAQGTCLLATDDSRDGRVVGFVLAGAQYPEDVEKHRQEAEELEQHAWGRICRLLSKVEREANLFERFGVSKVLYSHITSVDESTRGRGLGSRLAATLMEVGRSKGFPLMVAYCTSFYSARQKEALGMECIHAVAYADYKDSQGRPVFTPKPPHTHCRVMVIKL
ncbi:arylalkylamine N-acetyltransferase-like 2 [Drosophila bipectinata]|uniref:arylalkylamine N-acetyltransferase-like 2 n=1 Tax=Drosophila bipectinata TaxID=42026 RepID=UPI001C896285|nr:arylalkylamine N-acetyltransferase-like 2 [Drosophila bipectinata]